MIVVFVILGFVIGISAGSGLVAIALAGRLSATYWSLVKRHPNLANLARLAIISTVVACGVMFAYLGAVLAG